MLTYLCFKRTHVIYRDNKSLQNLANGIRRQLEMSSVFFKTQLIPFHLKTLTANQSFTEASFGRDFELSLTTA